jgi:ADP-heptose:LPS heptosyltransferase
MKILIVRFSSIGDIVLTTPVIRCLKQQTSAEIHYLTYSRFGELLAHHPGIDRLYTISNRLDEVLPTLRKERYDLIVDLHNNLRTMVLKLRLGRPVAVVRKLNFRKYLLVRLGVNLMPDLHIADRYLATVRHLGVINDMQGLDYYPDPEVLQRAESLLPGPFREGYAAVVIGGRYNTKIYPADRVAEVIRLLPLPVVLLGGSEDGERAGAILSDVAGRKVFNGCGAFSLHESAAIVASSRLVITNDTGMMHIAAAFNRKIISLWGNTVPELGMYPYMPGMPESYSEIVEIKGLSCRPCSKIGFQECPKKHFRCMRDISPDRVSNAAEIMLADRLSERTGDSEAV